MEIRNQELDLRNLDIVTEVSAKGGLLDAEDYTEPFEIWTFTWTIQS